MQKIVLDLVLDQRSKVQDGSVVGNMTRGVAVCGLCGVA